VTTVGFDCDRNRLLLAGLQMREKDCHDAPWLAVPRYGPGVTGTHFQHKYCALRLKAILKAISTQTDPRRTFTNLHESAPIWLECSSRTGYQTINQNQPEPTKGPFDSMDYGLFWASPARDGSTAYGCPHD
jgi:hypothetical protein